MEILVCIKKVPDTASSIIINESKADIVREGLNYVINPYDEYAIEEALRIKENLKDATVTLVTVSSDDATGILRMGLAMGADRAIEVKDPIIKDSDSFSLAKVLTKIIGRSKFDLIFCGNKSVDDDCAQVGPMVAQLLGIPVAAFAVKFELFKDKGYAIVHREVEGAVEVVRLNLPCLVTAQKGLNTPRIPSLSGIMQSKKKEILELKLSDIGLSTADAGIEGSKIKRIGLCMPEERAKGVILQGELSDIAREAVKLLREKEKVL